VPPPPASKAWVRTAAASILVCAAGGALFSSGTNGLRAFTTEQARRLSIEYAPRRLPSVALEDQSGRRFALADYAGRGVAVNFIYTRCTTVCALLSSGFQRLHRHSGDEGAIQLLSISFDPRDTPKQLTEYGSHFGADGQTWRFARISDTTEIAGVLRTFGVVVIPDGNGDFQHNAAIHIVNADAKLARVLDTDAPPATIVRAMNQR
jgi:protein SCO1